jgi:hypothetical protein
MSNSGASGSAATGSKLRPSRHSTGGIGLLKEKSGASTRASCSSLSQAAATAKKSTIKSTPTPSTPKTTRSSEGNAQTTLAKTAAKGKTSSNGNNNNNSGKTVAKNISNSGTNGKHEGDNGHDKNNKDVNKPSTSSSTTTTPVSSIPISIYDRKTIMVALGPMSPSSITILEELKKSVKSEYLRLLSQKRQGKRYEAKLAWNQNRSTMKGNDN